MPKQTDERKFGEIASKIIFENERVRIWQFRLPAGADSPIHKHTLDHVLIQIGGDRIAVVPEPDTESPWKEYLEADVTPGHVNFGPRGGIERARNTGNEEFHEIIVELKD